MKTRWIVPGVFVGLAALIAFLVAGAGGGDDYDRNCVAGSYLIEGELVRPSPQSPIPISLLVTLGSDGTAAEENTTDFGAGVTPRFRCTGRGAWKWTGRREVVATLLAFDFDPEEIGTPGNSSSTIPRMTMGMRFDHRYERLRLEGIVEIFVPFPPFEHDPLDPDETPVAVLGLEGEGRRIPASL